MFISSPDENVQCFTGNYAIPVKSSFWPQLYKNVNNENWAVLNSLLQIVKISKRLLIHLETFLVETMQFPNAPILRLEFKNSLDLKIWCG